MRCLYVDLDGTLLGPGGALLLDGEERFSILGVRAIEACSRAGAEVVLMSGRRQATVAEIARLIAQPSYIFEAGSAFVLDGEERWLTGEWRPGTRTIHDQIEDSGARRCCSSSTRAGSSTTTRGTATARSPICSAAS